MHTHHHHVCNCAHVPVHTHARTHAQAHTRTCAYSPAPGLRAPTGLPTSTPVDGWGKPAPNTHTDTHTRARTRTHTYRLRLARPNRPVHIHARGQLHVLAFAEVQPLVAQLHHRLALRELRGIRSDHIRSDRSRSESNGVRATAWCSGAQPFVCGPAARPPSAP